MRVSWRSLLGLGPFVLFGGCFPQSSSVESVDSGLNPGGTLSVDSLRLMWSISVSWDDGLGGQCVDMTLINDGEDLDWWAFEIELTDRIANLTSSTGAVLSINGDILYVSPAGGGIEHGEEIDFQFCAEPRVEPVEILSFDYDISPRGGDDDEASPASSGSLAADSVLLTWRTTGETSYGGECGDFIVSNVTNQEILDWSLVVDLEGNSSITDFWGLIPVLNDARLTIYPASGSETIPAYGSREGTICLNPFEEPRSIVSSSVETAESGGGEGSGGDGGGDSGDSGDGGATEGGDGTTGSVSTEDFILTWRDNGTSKGGHCLELSLTNTSGEDIDGWRVDAALSGSADLEDYWGFTFSLTGTSLTVLPGAGGETFGPNETRSGTYCVDPLQVPVNAESVVTFADE